MTSIEALLLGLVQGLSEFIPVSSSGHLVLAEKLFQTGQDSFVFDTMLNIGTLAALAIYFRR
jgi:undecaprenyl-diphosphatase